MTSEQLLEDINFQLDAMNQTVSELEALEQDVRGRVPSRREMAAGAAFLAEFYGGVENILKRICQHYGHSLPEGPSWHIELFEWFCDPTNHGLPTLLDKELELLLDPFRRFRHVVHHGYVMNLDWQRVLPGIQCSRPVFESFRSRIKSIIFCP